MDIIINDFATRVDQTCVIRDRDIVCTERCYTPNTFAADPLFMVCGRDVLQIYKIFLECI